MKTIAREFSFFRAFVFRCDGPNKQGDANECGKILGAVDYVGGNYYFSQDFDEERLEVETQRWKFRLVEINNELGIGNLSTEERARRKIAPELVRVYQHPKNEARWCGGVELLFDHDNRTVVPEVKHFFKCARGHVRRPMGSKEMADVYFHNDNGSQYRSQHKRQVYEQLGIVHSSGRVATSFVNAAPESFFATRDKELLRRMLLPTREHAHIAIFIFIEGWYNTRRLHSTLGYVLPARFEALPERERNAILDTA